MKTYLAQISPHAGDLAQNLRDHLASVDHAVDIGADLIVFPELSLTGYEPTLASTLAIEQTDLVLQPLQEKSDSTGICIAVGMPTTSENGIRISIIIFRPRQERWAYHKRLLHKDELPFFVGGAGLPFIEIEDVKVAFGICYETLRELHFIEAAEHHADVFIASVAKPDRSTNKALLHFPTMAQTYGIPIMMVNSVGPCDDFVSNGRSTVWNSSGDLVKTLDANEAGYIVYEHKGEKAKT